MSLEDCIQQINERNSWSTARSGHAPKGKLIQLGKLFAPKRLDRLSARAASR